MTDRETILRLAFCQILRMPTFETERLPTSEMLRVSKELVNGYSDPSVWKDLDNASSTTLENLTAWIREAEAGIV